VINATTKSGTNNFHGEAWEFLRNQAFEARGYCESPDSPKASYKQNQFGGTLGVPIKKDKAFFFLDYEGARIHQAQADFASVPVGGESTGDFSSILGPQSTSCGPNSDQPCFDALGRPVFRINLFRSQGPSSDRHEITWQASMAGTFHIPERFGLLELVKPK
jgi:hypothetical protein